MTRHGIAALCAILLAACADAQSETNANVPAAEAPAPAAATEDGLIQGTPPGGLVDWVGEIESGLSGIARAVGEDAAAARKRALDLYVGRQEYLEMYYGTSGRLSGGATALAEAVMAAEQRFHDLMQLLNAPEPEPGAIEAAEAATLESYRAVRAEAETADVPAAPPGNVPAAGGA